MQDIQRSGKVYRTYHGELESRTESTRKKFNWIENPCDTYRLSSLLHGLGEPSPRTDVMFMIVLSWGEVSPSYLLCMYYFPSIYFLSLIFESCYHFNLPLIITWTKSGSIKIAKLLPFSSISEWNEVVKFIEHTMENWKAELKVRGKSLTELKIQRENSRKMLYHCYYLQ